MFYWHLAIVLAPVAAGLIATNKTFLIWFFNKYFPEELHQVTFQELGKYQNIKPVIIGRFVHHYSHRSVVKFYDYAA